MKDHLHERQSGAPGSMDSMRRFIRAHREAVTKELENWPVQVASQPRKPMYTVEVGTAKGSFATIWHDKPADNPLEAGSAEIEIKLDGHTVAFKQIGAAAQLAQMPRFPFGPPGGGPRGWANGRTPGAGEPPRGAPRPMRNRGRRSRGRAVMGRGEGVEGTLAAGHSGRLSRRPPSC